jgi:hypothetical protein
VLGSRICISACSHVAEKVLGLEANILTTLLSDWRDGNYNLIREYMKPIPR